MSVSVSLWMGLLFGLGAALQVAATVVKRLRRVRRVHDGRLRQAHQASKTLREKAKATLVLRRERRSLERELRLLEQTIETGEQTVQRHQRNENLVYVLDDRRNATDQAYMATVSHPDFSRISRNAPDEVRRSWMAGRRYLIYAAAEKMAASKLTMRFPSERGYSVSAVTPFAGDADEL